MIIEEDNAKCQITEKNEDKYIKMGKMVEGEYQGISQFVKIEIKWKRMGACMEKCIFFRSKSAAHPFFQLK